MPGLNQSFLKKALDSMTPRELEDVAQDVQIHLERLRAMHKRLENND